MSNLTTSTEHRSDASNGNQDLPLTELTTLKPPSSAATNSSSTVEQPLAHATNGNNYNTKPNNFNRARSSTHTVISSNNGNLIDGETKEKDNFTTPNRAKTIPRQE